MNLQIFLILNSEREADFLPKLPVCPYCHGVYRYGEVRKLSKYKNIQCRNCEKVFIISEKKEKIIYFSVICLLLIAINLLLFYTITGITIYHSLVFTVLFFSVSLIFYPFFIKFKKQNEDESEKKKKKIKSKKEK